MEINITTELDLKKKRYDNSEKQQYNKYFFIKLYINV